MADFGIMEIAAIGSALAAAAGTAVSITAANAQASAAQRSYDANVQAAKTNYLSQVRTVNDAEQQAEQKATDQKSDRLMRANSELGTIRVMASESGADATTYNALVSQEAYAEGADLSRLDDQYSAVHRSADATRENALGTFQDTVARADIAKDQAATNASLSATQAALSGIGSGLQIGSSYELSAAKRDALASSQANKLKNMAASRAA